MHTILKTFEPVLNDLFCSPVLVCERVKEGIEGIKAYIIDVKGRMFHKMVKINSIIKSITYKFEVSFLHRENTGSELVGINKGRGTI